MTTDKWIDGVANWNTAADWSGGIPTASSNVVVSEGDPEVTSAIAIAWLLSSAEIDFIDAGASTIAGAYKSSLRLNIDAGAGDGGSSLTVGTTLFNSGAVQIGNASMTHADVVTAEVVDNSGSLTLTGGASTSAEAVLDITGGDAGFGRGGFLDGSVSLSGHSEIEFAQGSITEIMAGATLTLDGPDAFLGLAGLAPSNSALSGLAVNRGRLILEGGATVTTTTALWNLGDILVDSVHGSVGGSSLTIGGVLSNGDGGGLAIGNAPSTATESSTVSAAGVYNSATSQILVGGGTTPTAEASFLLEGLAGFGTDGVVSGGVTVSGYGIIQFANGSISAIADDGALTLVGAKAFVADADAPSSNSALTGLSANSGSLDLEQGAAVTTDGGLINRDEIALDRGYNNNYVGGSSLTVGSVLNNENILQIGNASMTHSATVTVNGIRNSGEITLNGGTSKAGEAVLDVEGAAGFGSAGVLSGSLRLSGDALVEFASEQISSIASGVFLTLTGPNAFVADLGSVSSNSALTGLTTIAGELDLEQGASLTTSGGLTNTDNISLNTLISNPAGASLSVGGVLTNSARIYMGADSGAATPGVTSVTASGGIVNSGSIDIFGPDAMIGSAVSGTGSFNLYYAGATPTVEFDASVGGGQSVFFQGRGQIVFGTGGAESFAGVINGWQNGDLLDVKGFGTGTTENFAGGILTLTNGSSHADFAFSGATASEFSLTSTATASTVKFV